MESIATIEEENVFDSDKIDEISELKALARSIKRAKGFSLLFARCNQRPKQIELQQKIISEIPDRSIIVLYFEKGIENLLDELRKRLQKEKPDAVFVYGLESSMPKSEVADKTPFVLNLNASRNAFPSVVDCPVVFWLPDYGIKAIMNGAPDFFSVRSGVFFFETDAEMMSQQTFQEILTNYWEHDALLLEERQQRIENLKELLAEHQSLPENKRDLQIEYQLKDKLADIYYIAADFSEAERLRKEILKVSRQMNDEETAVQLNNLALISDLQGKYDEASELFKEALLIIEKTIGKEHPDYASSLNNLASVYQTQGKYDEAIKLYQEALLIDEKTIGKEHPTYATRLNNLASLYKLQSKYKEAIELFKEALLIDEKTIGKEHPDYAIDLNNLAMVYNSQGKYDEAIELFKEAKDITEKSLGKEHPAHATRLNNLAMVYDSQGRYDEAIKLYQEALLIIEKTIGKEHPTYASSLNNLASVYDSRGKYEEALPMYVEALRIFVKFLGENHPSTQTVKGNLEICREALKKKKNGEQKTENGE